VAPGLIDIFVPFGGNPDLDPETSKSYELGLAGNHVSVKWSANIYRTEIKDLIQYVPTGPFTGMTQNVSEAVIEGLEIVAGTTFAGIDFDGQFSWMNPEDRSGGQNDGNVLARRAEQTFTFNALKAFGDFSIASQVFASGRRFDDAMMPRITDALLVTQRST